LKILIDTNAFIWASYKPDLLTEAARAAITNRANERFVSLATLWEMQIKKSLGKLPLPGAIDVIARAWAQALATNFLPVELTHIAALDRLPQLHRDPFDRMIAAQALTEGMAIVSSDAVFRSYPVNSIW
jgi:PIN domain nuclease of toxin-antitoxin system